MDDDADQIMLELLDGYEKWKKDQNRKEPDVSPRAYLAVWRTEAAVKAVKEGGEAAAAAIPALELVISEFSEGNPRLEGLENALKVCNLVKGAS